MKKTILIGLQILTASLMFTGCATTNYELDSFNSKEDIGKIRKNTLVFVSDNEKVYFDIFKICEVDGEQDIKYSLSDVSTYVRTVKLDSEQYVHNIRVSKGTPYDINMREVKNGIDIVGKACVKRDNTLSVSFNYKNKYLESIEKNYINEDFYLEKPKWKHIDITSKLTLKPNEPSLINKIRYKSMNPLKNKYNNIYLYWNGDK